MFEPIFEDQNKPSTHYDLCEAQASLFEIFKNFQKVEYFDIDLR
jgi:hypothetical protein